MISKKIVFFCISVIFSVSFVSTKAFADVVCDPNQNLDGKTPIELAAISAQCDKDLATTQATLYDNQKQQTTIKQGIADLTATINKSQAVINTKTAQIKVLGQNIVEKTKYIGQLSDRMDNIKKSISKMLRDNNMLDNTSIMDVLLSNQDLSNFFVDADNYATINSKLHDLIQELNGVKKTSENEKTDLESKKAQQEKLKYEEVQAKTLSENYKKAKQQILDITINQESTYKKIIADKEKLKNQIRNRLYRTTGGEEISFGDALKIVQPYESTIGISSALVLAVLFQESAVDSTIGKNIGKCTYNQPSACIYGKTVMSDTQKPYYLNIMSNLGMDANTTPISCAICRDGNYGGAMGPAQFMPLTWDGISKRVSSIIGISYPSPFENKAAFAASAVLLRDNQNRCQTAFTKKSDLWSCSAAKYYGGLSLSGTKLRNSMNYGYGAAVLTRALQFEKDIATLSL